LPSGVPGAPSPPPSTEKKSPKALDLLHQVAFSGHKIHELGPSSSKSHSPPPSKIDCPPKDSTTSSISSSKSPPPQRHLHTHHHTHVGVGYPLYDPYGAAIIASQQAAASIHPFAPKWWSGINRYSHCVILSFLQRSHVEVIFFSSEMVFSLISFFLTFMLYRDTSTNCLSLIVLCDRHWISFSLIPPSNATRLQ